MAKKSINVLIADNYNLMRAGLRHILESVPDIKVIGEAASSEEAIRGVRDLHPEVVLLDIKMPGIGGGLEVARKMLQVSSDLKILAISTFDDISLPARYMQIGVIGYLTKESNKTELVQAVRAISLGQRYISPYVAQQLVLKRFGVEDKSPFDTLSNRELQISLLVAQGLKTKEIAGKLHLTTKTVNSYRYRIFTKLNLTSNVGLARLAQMHQIIE
jgi:two-component system, NarL family, invasion response regulator UvrY